MSIGINISSSIFVLIVFGGYILIVVLIALISNMISNRIKHHKEERTKYNIGRDYTIIE